jgi:hypothetical protein
VKPVAISATDALTSPKLFAPFFAGDSWNLWRAVIKAMNAEPMNAAETALFRSVAERDPPAKPVHELVAVAGRGGGKDSVASLLGTTAAVNFHGKLRPGERAVVMCLACDREQAKIVYNYIRAYFEQIPALAKMVMRITDDTIELRNHVDIEVHTNSYRSVRGRSLLCAIFDEVSFWRSEDSASPDFEVAGAIQPALARVPGSTLILISSAHKRSGLLYQKWKDHYGRNDDDVLVVRARRRNSTLPSTPRSSPASSPPIRSSTALNTTASGATIWPLSSAASCWKPRSTPASLCGHRSRMCSILPLTIQVVAHTIPTPWPLRTRTRGAMLSSSI